MSDADSSNGFLNKAYEAETLTDTDKLYQDWADTYDDEVSKNGYASPARCAAALAEFTPNNLDPILDLGCGTGISGTALAEVGFTTVDGCDLNQEMLDIAAKKATYRNLWKADLHDPFPFEIGTYSHIAAVGIIASGHAPPETIDAVLAVLPADGLFVFSLNDHTLEDPAFEARVAENLDTGFARLLFKEHGDHLPGVGMKSKVYVLQKI